VICLHRRGEEGEEFWLNVLLIERVYGDVDTFISLKDGQHFAVADRKDAVVRAIRREMRRIFAPAPHIAQAERPT
jgi:uncharacterized protein YlzI (FlbEa/FlbD family)